MQVILKCGDAMAQKKGEAEWASPKIHVVNETNVTTAWFVL